MEERDGGSKIPELAGLAEIAAILGVSKQRVRELAAQDNTFPQPVAELSGGAIYVKSMIEEYKQRSTRQSGRPNKAHAQVMSEMEHIQKIRGDLPQQTFRMIFNSIRRHDLSIDPLTPAGQSLFRSIEIARKQHQDADIALRYDAEFFHPEPPDRRYIEHHADCCCMTKPDQS